MTNDKPQDDKKYLFEYYHKGDWWCIEIFASSPEDAQERVNKLFYAKYVGEVAMELPGSLNWLTRLICYLRNLATLDSFH